MTDAPNRAATHHQAIQDLELRAARLYLQVKHMPRRHWRQRRELRASFRVADADYHAALGHRPWGFAIRRGLMAGVAMSVLIGLFALLLHAPTLYS